MLSKSFILVLFCYSTIYIISASDTVRAPVDDAEAAFQDLIAFSTDILNTKYNETSTLQAEAHLQLDAMQQEALDVLARKVAEIKSKAAEIADSLVVLDIYNNCNYSRDNLDNYQINATKRIAQCTELSKGVISNIFAETWDDFTLQEGSYMGCVGRSLGYCHAYATDDRCFEHVVSFIAIRKVNLQDAFERIHFNFKNKLTSFVMPCQKMLDFEMSVFPDYYLRHMTGCAEMGIEGYRPSMCAGSL